MEPKELTEKDFAATVAQEGIVILDVWAPWCGPCRAFAPVFEQVAATHPDITFAKVNTEDEPGLASALGITSIPTLMAFRDGVLIYARPGFVPAAALEELIGRIRALDMAEVKAAVAKEESRRTASAEAPA